MAALSADNTVIPASKQLSPDGYFSSFGIVAATTIYKNSFVGLNAAGYLKQYVAPASDTTQVGDRFIGIAMEHVVNSGAVGVKVCKVQTMGDFSYALSGVGVLDIGKPVFVSDDQTLSISGSGNAYVGTIVGYNVSGYCTIRMPGPQMAGLGKFIFAVSPIIDTLTLNDLALLVHETQNHNGLLLLWAGLLCTTQFDCDATAGVITLGHTTGTNTSIGCTMTGADSLPANDIVIGVGGGIMIGAAATNDTVVPIPADVAVIAKVTTASTDAGTAAGAGKVMACFAVL